MILVSACQMTTDSMRTVKRTPVKRLSESDRIDASSLTVALEIKNYIKQSFEPVFGVILIPTLDPRADYISYRACVKGDEINCARGELDGLVKEPKFNFPLGDLLVSYRACILKTRARNEECGPEKQEEFINEGRNSQKVASHLEEQDRLTSEIRRYTFGLSDQLKDPHLVNSATRNIDQAFAAVSEQWQKENPYKLASQLTSIKQSSYRLAEGVDSSEAKIKVLATLDCVKFEQTYKACKAIKSTAQQITVLRERLNLLWNVGE